MQVKIIACSAIVDNSLFHPAATASWQWWAQYKLANPLYEYCSTDFVFVAKWWKSAPKKVKTMQVSGSKTT